MFENGFDQRHMVIDVCAVYQYVVEVVLHASNLEVLATRRLLVRGFGVGVGGYGCSGVERESKAKAMSTGANTAVVGSYGGVVGLTLGLAMSE